MNSPLAPLTQLPSLINQIRTFIKLLRIYNTRSMLLFYLLGWSYTTNLTFHPNQLVAFTIFVSTYAFASIINFQSDKSIDKTNNRRNYLITNPLTTKAIKNLLIYLALLSIVIPLLASKPLLYLTTSIILLLLGMAYSGSPLNISHHPIGKILSMSLVYVYIPLLLGTLTQSTNTNSLAFPALIGLIYTSWLIYTDIKDLKGDRLHKKRTLVVILGIKQACGVSFVISLIALVGINILYPTINPYTNTFLHLVLVLQLMIFIKPSLTLNQTLRSIMGYSFFALMAFLIFSSPAY